MILTRSDFVRSKINTDQRLSANNKFFIYMSSLHVNEAIKSQSFQNLKVSNVYCKFFFIITAYF